MALPLDTSEWCMEVCRNGPELIQLMNNGVTEKRRRMVKTKDSDGGCIKTKLEWCGGGSLYKPGLCETGVFALCFCVCVDGWSCPWCGAGCVEGGAQQDRWCQWADEWIMMFRHSAVITCCRTVRMAACTAAPSLHPRALVGIGTATAWP